MNIERAAQIADTLLQQGFEPIEVDFKPFAERIVDALLQHGFEVAGKFKSDFVRRNSGFVPGDDIFYRLEWWTTFRGSVLFGFQLHVLMTPEEDKNRIHVCQNDLNSIFRDYLLAIGVPQELADTHPSFVGLDSLYFFPFGARKSPGEVRGRLTRKLSGSFLYSEVKDERKSL